MSNELIAHFCCGIKRYRIFNTTTTGYMLKVVRSTLYNVQILYLEEESCMYWLRWNQSQLHIAYLTYPSSL